MQCSRSLGSLGAIVLAIACSPGADNSQSSHPEAVLNAQGSGGTPASGGRDATGGAEEGAEEEGAKERAEKGALAVAGWGGFGSGGFGVAGSSGFVGGGCPGCAGASGRRSGGKTSDFGRRISPGDPEWDAGDVVKGACTDDQPLCQRHDGRSWSDAAEPKSFSAATDYCRSLGGRLPTISELRGLLHDCSTTRLGGQCRVADDCTSELDCGGDCTPGCGDGGESVFGHDETFWSSTPVSDQEGALWTVCFRYGMVRTAESDGQESVFCIDSSK